MKKRGSLIVVLLIVVFASLASSMSINVSSPVEGKYYDTASINVSVDFGEFVNWWVYHNNEQEWSSQGSSLNNLLTAIEGTNTIRVSASNSTANINSSTITFYVDTLYPNITSQTPANNSNVSKGNVTFSVGYTEANLNFTKLYWRTNSSYNEENVSSCDSGASKSCSRIIDFSSYFYWENISYFFSLIDKTSKYTNSSVYTFKIVPCIQNWILDSSWSTCSNGYHHKNYYDSNNCGNDTGKPSPLNETCCAPNCAGKSCGDDGCGGSCGSCDSGYSCVDGSCSSSSEDTGTTTNTQENTNVQNINYFLSSSQIGNGSLRTLKLVGDKISFKIKNESHSLELRKIYSDKVSIKISSVEQYANLTLNDVKKFDLTADGYYDISVILKRLNSSEADILLNTTNEKVPETTATTNHSNSLTTSVEITGDALTEIANKTEFTESGITGGFLGAFENMKKAPPYLLIVFSLIILGLLSITISKVIRKKKRRKKGYYK